MGDTLRTSGVRVFGKSMHTLSAGWMVSVGWLWTEEIRQHVLRIGATPADYGAATAISGAVPAALMALAGMAVSRWTGPAPSPRLERREWWHAFWWSLAPNLQLLVTVWVMIQEAR
jgi:hypothetical protein